MIKKILALTFFLPVFANAAIISDPSGAFGIEFGKQLKDLTVLEKNELRSGEPVYKVKAPNPLNNKLEDYYVLVTPESHKVYTIWGNKDYERMNRDKCINEKDDIVAILESKYGESKSATTINIDNDRVFELDNVNIYAVCQNLGQNLSIRYINKGLQDLYEKEKKEQVIKQTDSSML